MFGEEVEPDTKAEASPAAEADKALADLKRYLSRSNNSAVPI